MATKIACFYGGMMMGVLIDGIKAAFTGPAKRSIARERMAEAELESAGHINTMLGEAAKAVAPENDGFTLVGGDMQPLTGSDKRDMRESSMVAAFTSPLPSGILKSLEAFVIGKGVTYSPTVEDEQVEQTITGAWSDWAKRNGWKKKEREIARRMWRDGEVFIQKITPSNDPVKYDMQQMRTLKQMNMGGMEPQPPPTDEVIGIRLIDPGKIKDPTGAFSDGIITDSNDVERVVGYVFCEDEVGVNISFIPADDVIHIKIRSDSDMKRGRSIFEPVLKLNTRYEQWLDYRLILSKVRTAVAWVKTVAGTPSQRSAIRDAQKVDRPGLDQVRGENRLQVPRAGTMITASPGIEYDFKSPNLQASDAMNDGREIKLNVSAAMNLPEYMVTGDASNANFSSTMVAESPGVREFEYWQDELTGPLAKVWSWVLTAMNEAGIISVPDDAIDANAVQLVWGQLIARDELKTTQANQIRNASGILSKQTWADEDGLDWDTERERIQTEMQDDIDMGLAGFPGQDDDDDIDEPEPDE